MHVAALKEGKVKKLRRKAARGTGRKTREGLRIRETRAGVSRTELPEPAALGSYIN